MVVFVARGVASLVPIERLSERVNIFLNTKHMHILWGPMCVSYPEILALSRCACTRTGPRWGPPFDTRMENEAAWLPESSISRHHGKKKEWKRKRERSRKWLEAVTAWQLLLIVMWFSSPPCLDPFRTIINDRETGRSLVIRRKKFDSTLLRLIERLPVPENRDLILWDSIWVGNYRGLTRGGETVTDGIGFGRFQDLIFKIWSMNKMILNRLK